MQLILVMKRYLFCFYQSIRNLVGFRIKWTSFSKSQILIFETINIDYLLPLCGNATVAQLDVSDQIIYLNFRLLLLLIKYICFGARIKVAYYASLIKLVDPIIVITFIDNTGLFYQVAKVGHKERRFLAIQNAARYDILELTPKQARRIFIPEFACFGDYERDLYIGRSAHVGTFYPVGSLRESYFRRYLDANIHLFNANCEYDLCVIAEASPGWDILYPGFEEAIGKIAQYAIRFAREQGLKMVIAGKRDLHPHGQRSQMHSRNSEIAWYYKYIGSDVSMIVPRVREQFTTYSLVSRSRLSLAMISTALREGMSRGRRVLFCNFSGNPIWNFCVDDICSLTKDSYDAFAERLQYILSLSDETYYEMTKAAVKYVIKNTDSMSTDSMLSTLIADAILVKQTT